MSNIDIYVAPDPISPRNLGVGDLDGTMVGGRKFKVCVGLCIVIVIAFG